MKTVTAALLMALLLSCTTTRTDSPDQSSELKIKQNILPTANFVDAIKETGNNARDFCFSIVENPGNSYLFVQANPCSKTYQPKGVLVKIESVIGGAGLYLDGIQIGKFAPNQLEVDALCTGFFKNACSITLDKTNKSVAINKKNVVDQGVVEKPDDRALFQFQIVESDGSYNLYAS